MKGTREIRQSERAAGLSRAHKGETVHATTRSALVEREYKAQELPHGGLEPIALTVALNLARGRYPKWHGHALYLRVRAHSHQYHTSKVEHCADDLLAAGIHQGREVVPIAGRAEVRLADCV